MLLYLNLKRDALELYDDESLTLLDSTNFSTIEFNVLSVLYQNSYKPCSRQQLKQAGWPDRVVGPNSLNVCIMHLRKKLKSTIADTEIRVVPSKGYKLLLPASVQLVHEGSLLANKINDKSNQSNEPITLIRPYITSVTEEVENIHIVPNITTSPPLIQKRFRWGDLIATICIWIYTIALYQSIFN